MDCARQRGIKLLRKLEDRTVSRCGEQKMTVIKMHSRGVLSILYSHEDERPILDQAVTHFNFCQIKPHQYASIRIWNADMLT